jgi:hypothetical protein
VFFPIILPILKAPQARNYVAQRVSAGQKKTSNCEPRRGRHTGIKVVGVQLLRPCMMLGPERGGISNYLGSFSAVEDRSDFQIVPLERVTSSILRRILGSASHQKL